MCGLFAFDLATFRRKNSGPCRVIRRGLDQCGDPSCACFRDPARRHGPHLYLKFNAEGKTHSVYVPPEQGEAIKSAHGAWLRFQEIGTQVSADNRARWLRALERDKRAARAKRARRQRG